MKFLNLKSTKEEKCRHHIANFGITICFVVRKESFFYFVVLDYYLLLLMKMSLRFTFLSQISWISIYVTIFFHVMFLKFKQTKFFSLQLKQRKLLLVISDKKYVKQLVETLCMEFLFCSSLKNLYILVTFELDWLSSQKQISS